MHETYEVWLCQLRFFEGVGLWACCGLQDFTVWLAVLLLDLGRCVHVFACSGSRLRGSGLWVGSGFGWKLYELSEHCSHEHRDGAVHSTRHVILFSQRSFFLYCSTGEFPWLIPSTCSVLAVGARIL